ncbi:hypothetical protein ACLOJK_005682 [Asimina triloba]
MGARARPPCTHEHEHGAPKVLHHLHELGGSHCRRRARRRCPPRRSSPPANAARRRQHTTPVAAMHLLTVDGDEEDDKPTPTVVGPTIAGPSSPPSKPFIMTGTTSTFQIHRGRKPTLITEATRGRSSSPPELAASLRRCCRRTNITPPPLCPNVTAPGRCCGRLDRMIQAVNFFSRPIATPVDGLHRLSTLLAHRPRRCQQPLPVPPAFAEAAHVNAPCSSRLQHVVNVSSTVDDRRRRFALKAAAKATVPAATVSRKIFYK